MIPGLSKHGVALLAALAILAGEALSISQLSLAQTAQCSAQQIENNIENLLTDPALVDTLAACGSDALPILLLYLDRSFIKEFEKSNYDSLTKAEQRKVDSSEYQQLLIISTLGQMGSRASSSTRDLGKLIGRRSMAEELDKVIVYALWQINGDPTRALAQIAVDTREDLSARSSALHTLEGFARDYANLIPGGVNSQRLEKTTNDALVTIALNPNDDVDFRLNAFGNLKGARVAPNTVARIQDALVTIALNPNDDVDFRLKALADLKEARVAPNTVARIQDAITDTLLKVIQDPTRKTEQRLDAVFKVEYTLYERILKAPIKPAHIQIIAPVLTQIILDTNNTPETRHTALFRLKTFDGVLAEKIAKEVSLPESSFVLRVPPKAAASLRESTVVKLKAAPPAVCRYPVIQAVFAWKCR